MSGGPLSGLKVVELAGIGPGPFCAMMLADMGADVIRVDRAQTVFGGDPATPPADVLNRGRRSVGVDLKNPDGVETVLRSSSSRPTRSSRGSGPASPSGSASAPTCASPATPSSSTGA